MFVRGYNEFYEGWLAYVLCQPDDATRPENWREGWKMGEETGPRAVEALRSEIELGHVQVIPELEWGRPR